MTASFQVSAESTDCYFTDASDLHSSTISSLPGSGNTVVDAEDVNRKAFMASTSAAASRIVSVAVTAAAITFLALMPPDVSAACSLRDEYLY
jgi:hypothetical protein